MLIACSYVHGIMDGEAIQQQREGAYELQRFDLV